MPLASPLPSNFDSSPILRWYVQGDHPGDLASFAIDAYAHSSGSCAATVERPVNGQVLTISLATSLGTPCNLERSTGMLQATRTGDDRIGLELNPGVSMLGAFVVVKAGVGTSYDARLWTRLNGSLQWEAQDWVSGTTGTICAPGSSTYAPFVSAQAPAGSLIVGARFEVRCTVPTGPLGIGKLYFIA